MLLGAITPHSIAGEVASAYRDHLFQDRTLQRLPDQPTFVINATNLASGALFRFTKAYLADWRVGQVNRPTVTLAAAVAASSAFPPFLAPYRLDLSDATWTDEPATLLPARNTGVICTSATAGCTTTSAWRPPGRGAGR